MNKVVIFDLDNTFYNYQATHDYSINKLFEHQKLYGDIENFLNSYEKAKSQVKSIVGDSTSSHNRILYFKKMLENENKDPLIAIDLEKKYWEIFINQVVINNRTYELLSKLRKQNAILHLYTNLDTNTQLMKLKKWNLNYFDRIITSEDVGCEKPDLKFILEVKNYLDAFYKKSFKFFAIGDDVKNDLEPWKKEYKAETYLINNNSDSDFVDFQLSIEDSLEKIVNQT